MSKNLNLGLDRPGALLVIPFMISDDGYSVMVVLQDENVERIKEHDPVVLDSAEILAASRVTGRLKEVIITYGDLKDLEVVSEYILRNDLPSALRHVTRGYRFRPDRGDGKPVVKADRND